jgi:competence protein ComEC
MMRYCRTHPFQAAAAFLVGLMPTIWWPVPRETGALVVTFLDVGQGDSIVVETPSGRTVVVDTGRGENPDDMGRRVLVPFLRSRGITAVDELVLTHGDGDHVGGALSLLRSIPVRHIITGKPALSAEEMQPLLTEVRRMKAGVQTVHRGQFFETPDGVRFEVLGPAEPVPAGFPHPDNNHSVVLKVLFGRTSILLTGDAEAEAEADMVRSLRNLPSDVLKLGHHGSRTSSTSRFLQSVRAKVGVVSCGRGNSYGHPHPDVVRRASQMGMQLIRTDTMGTLTLRSDGRQIRATTGRHAPRR